jgi:putative Mg2+ transporter-C (MgtC) family protein
MYISDLEIILRIFISLILSSIIGIERERHSKPAGLRTHILVCVGANLIMLVSLLMAQKYGEISPSRIAAQVVSGIGFLGAGTIIVSRGLVKGLTTAASLWAVAAIGLAVGAGFYKGAIITTLLIIFILYVFEFFEKKILKGREYKQIILKVDSLEEKIEKARNLLKDYKVTIRDVEIKHLKEGGEIKLTAKIPENIKIIEEIVNELLKFKGVLEVEIKKTE